MQKQGADLKLEGGKGMVQACHKLFLGGHVGQGGLLPLLRHPLLQPTIIIACQCCTAPVHFTGIWY